MNKIYIVEEIISHRKRSDGKYEYFVKWKDYDSKQNTWEPEENFESPKILEDYHESVGEVAPYSISKQIESISDDIPNPVKRNPKKTLDTDSLLTTKQIDELDLVPEKVLNIFHVYNNEKLLVAFIRFKNKSKPEFVRAAWANKNCPHLVIKFYESRIFWRDKKSGELIKGRNIKTKTGPLKN